MSETVLVAETGRPTGSSASRRLRAEDRIPAVVYGHGMTPLSISVARRDLRQALSGSAGMNTVLDLTVDGKVYPAIVKEIQRHPVRRNVQHVDFQQVSLDEQITVSVPLRLEGEAREVLSNNGLVDPAVDSIDVTTTPRNIPDEIVIDITEMQLDSVIRLEDITLPAGVTTSLDPETVLVTVLVTRGAEEETEAAEGAEGEESGEGETAEGAEAGEAEAASGDEA
jgi:large subunit ribosomal protein L25